MKNIMDSRVRNLQGVSAERQTYADFLQLCGKTGRISINSLGVAGKTRSHRIGTPEPFRDLLIGMAERSMTPASERAEHKRSEPMKDDLVERLGAIGEEEMYQAPATTRATIEEAIDAIESLQRQLAEAVANEREACAKAAERERVVEVGPGDDAYNRACCHIAAAIRERSNG